MKPSLATILACPKCHAPLQLAIDVRDHEQILSGSLHCRQCPRTFPIKEGIPRFVSSESYVSSFSFEWKRWRWTQFDTASCKSSRSTFVASTGRLPEELAGKLGLDAGCGAGRYMDLLARAGAEIVGLDLSLAIEVAKQNLGHLPNCHFIQGNLLHPPFLPGTFDFAYSIGVLHHTPDTRQAFLRMAETLKPQGEAAIWVYPRYRLAETFEYFPERVNEVLAQDVKFQIQPKWENVARRFARVLDWSVETSSEFQRFFTTRLPIRWLYWLCHAAVPLYHLYRIPVFYPLRLITRIAMDPDPEWRVLHTFDWYSPRYQWKHTYAEVRAWFEEAGLEDVTILARPVAVRGTIRRRQTGIVPQQP